MHEVQARLAVVDGRQVKHGVDASIRQSLHRSARRASEHLLSAGSAVPLCRRIMAAGPGRIDRCRGKPPGWKL